MKYKLIKDIFETSFDEFFPGRCKEGEEKHSYYGYSVFLSSSAMILISDCLHKTNNGYDRMYNTVFSKEKEQIQLLVEELKIRLAEIIDDKDFSGKFEDEQINDLKKHKTEIIEMIRDLIEWIENLKENELTVIPDNDVMLRIVLGGI